MNSVRRSATHARHRHHPPHAFVRRRHDPEIAARAERQPVSRSDGFQAHVRHLVDPARRMWPAIRTRVTAEIPGVVAQVARGTCARSQAYLRRIPGGARPTPPAESVRIPSVIAVEGLGLAPATARRAPGNTDGGLRRHWVGARNCMEEGEAVTRPYPWGARRACPIDLRRDRRWRIRGVLGAIADRHACRITRQPRPRTRLGTGGTECVRLCRSATAQARHRRAGPPPRPAALLRDRPSAAKPREAFCR